MFFYLNIKLSDRIVLFNVVNYPRHYSTNAEVFPIITPRKPKPVDFPGDDCSKTTSRISSYEKDTCCQL
jgi:hypothetical protein